MKNSRVIAACAAIGLVFTSLASYIDDYISTDDTSVQTNYVGDRIVYVFTNTASTATVTLLQRMTLKDALVVGGGGAGGNVVAGGGGGGAVVTLAVERVCFQGRTLSVKVGDGGGLGGAHNSFSTGLQGALSVLTLPDASELVAFGGGGGGGYQLLPSSAANGEIASGGGGGGGGTYSGGADGVNYNSLYGFKGGTSVTDYGGGGGGAAFAGLNGSSSGSNGGEGVTNSISGVAVVYGSGGGGGARNSLKPGKGGTNGGAGTNGQSTVRAYFGVDGTGGGGGGGGYVNAGGFNYDGGDGGSGTIILSFVTGGDVGQPTISALGITYPNGMTQPKVSVTLGNSKPDYTFSAVVTAEFYTTDPDTILDTLTFSGVLPNSPVEGLARFCVPAGTMVYAKVTVTSEEAETVSQTTSAEAEGEIEEHFGRGGGANVIHVRPGALGKNDGSDWFHAYTDFRAAIQELSAERPELWFAGDETVAGAKPTINPAIAATIRGGFVGTEDSVAARAKGARSMCDAVSFNNCFTFANAAAVVLDGFTLKRGLTHNLEKSGSGDLTVTNCVFCDTSGAGQGRGAYVRGNSATTVRFVDVRFANIFGGGTVNQNFGTVLNLGALARAYVDDCAFTTNGCPFTTGFSNSMYDQNGAAILASGAPLTVRNTRFVGNRSQALQGGGGVIRIKGACGATTFTNCVFVGNETVHGFGNYTQFQSPSAGMVALSPSSGTVDLNNCTFAHNLAEVNYGAAGVSVFSGTANIRNSVFYGNTNGFHNTSGIDIAVSAGATANIAYCLFEDASANRIGCLGGGTTNYNAATFVYGDPLFVTTDPAAGSFVTAGTLGLLLKSDLLGAICAFNVHLQGGRGYYDETTGALVTDYRTGESPALDAGDPTSDYSREPYSQQGWHGRRVNLGAYGNTPYATMSSWKGTFLILR